MHKHTHLTNGLEDDNQNSLIHQVQNITMNIEDNTYICMSFCINNMHPFTEKRDLHALDALSHRFEICCNRSHQ